MNARAIIEAESPKKAMLRARVNGALRQVDAMKRWALVRQWENKWLFQLTHGRHELSFKLMRDQNVAGLYDIYFYHKNHGILGVNGDFEAASDEEAVEKAKAKATVFFHTEGFFKPVRPVAPRGWDVIEAEDPKKVWRQLRGPAGNGPIREIAIIGRRWRQRLYGNTYHSANVFVNGKHVHRIDFDYGYGNQYEWNGWLWLVNKGYVNPRRFGGQSNNPESPWTYCERNGIKYTTDVTDVRRRKDL